MKPQMRRVMAYIAGRLISGSQSSAVYDYAERGYTSFSGTVDSNAVAVYDYGVRCQVSGAPSNLYHYGERHHISLSVNGTQFSGYDYGSRSHFSGNVNGRNVSVYDYSAGAHFSYQI